MEYVIFAFSSMSVGFAFLLAVLTAGRRKQPPRLGYLLAAAALGTAYYFLETNVFSDLVLTYYLANILPHLALLALLAVFLCRRADD